jgi:DNA-directed RNA polymerase specialized sigma24 family protein
MHKDDIEVFRKRAFSYAYRLCRNRETAEDCAGEAVLIVLEHPQWRHNNVRYRVCDVVRGLIGRSGSRFNEQRKALQFALSVDPWGDRPQANLRICDDRLEASVLTTEYVMHRLEWLNPRQRFIALRILRGWAYLDIAKLIGVTESRVAHIRKDIEKVLRGEKPRWEGNHMLSETQKKFLSGKTESTSVTTIKDYKAERKAHIEKRYRAYTPWAKGINEQTIELEIRLIKQAMAEGGDKAKAAFIMGINRTTLVEKMKKLGMQDITAKQCRDELKIQVTEEDVA